MNHENNFAPRQSTFQQVMLVASAKLSVAVTFAFVYALLPKHLQRWRPASFIESGSTARRLSCVALATFAFQLMPHKHNTHLEETEAHVDHEKACSQIFQPLHFAFMHTALQHYYRQCICYSYRNCIKVKFFTNVTPTYQKALDSAIISLSIF